MSLHLITRSKFTLVSQTQIQNVFAMQRLCEADQMLLALLIHPEQVVL